VPYNFGWVNSGFSIIYWDLNLALLEPLAFGFILRGFKWVLTLTTLYECMRSNLHPPSKVFFIELALCTCPVVIYSTLFSSIRFSKYCYRCCEMVRNCSFLFELFRTELLASVYDGMPWSKLSFVFEIIRSRDTIYSGHLFFSVFEIHQ